MRYATNSAREENVLQVITGGTRNGLRVKRYEPHLVRDKLLRLPERRKYSLHRREGEIERIVRGIYEEYASLFSLKSERNMAVCATEYYTEALHRYMEMVSGPIDAYCRITGQEGLYNRIPQMVSECESFLLQGLREELRENAARYVLRPIFHYVRLAKLRLAHFEEDRKKAGELQDESCRREEIYLYEVCEAVLADCTELLDCFSKKAQFRYEAYVDVLCLWFGHHQIDLPEYADGEEWNTFCHALERKRRAALMNGQREVSQPEKKYAFYVPCTCGAKTCKTWRIGDEADYELAKWYGTWYGEGGECFEFTEGTIGGRAYCVKRCYMDLLPRGKRTHIEFWCEDNPEELWTMHIGRNLLGLTGEDADLYYVILENMEHQILRLYCEDERVFLDENDSREVYGNKLTLWTKRNIINIGKM